MRISSPFRFVKMHGSGNDFVVIALPNPALDGIDWSELTRRLCRKGTGLGADGVILIRPSESADFHWQYINADGTDGEMCGNGAMVGARYAVDHGIAGEHCTFDTATGIVRAKVDGENVTLDMIDARKVDHGLMFDALPGVEFDCFMIGVPHVVGFVDDVDAIDTLDAIGRTIRNDMQVLPAGTNVNLVNRIDANTIRMRTYERGVEAETLACGTGAVCSAISAVQHGVVSQPVTVRVSSGMDLTVTWKERGQMMTDIRLGGTARVVAQGEILPEALVD
jgi:diaminopimelate epimerase